MRLNDAYGKKLDPYLGSPTGEKPIIAGTQDFFDTVALMEARDAAHDEYQRARGTSCWPTTRRSAREVNMSKTEQEVYVTCEQKRKAEWALRSRHVSVGTGRIKGPELMVMPEAMRALHTAEGETRAAYSSYIEACRAPVV